MTNPSRVRRFAAAAAAVAALHAALLNPVSADLLPSPTPRSAGTASTASAPSPTPCPVPAPLCGLGATPTPTPSPSGSASPSGSPSGSGGGSGGSGGGSSSHSPTPSPPAASGAAGATTAAPSAPPSGPGSPAPSAGVPASPAAPAQPASPALLAQTAAHFKNAPFLGSLLDILAHPAAAGQPDLRHFRPLDAIAPAGAAAAPTGSVRPPGGAPPPSSTGDGGGGRGVVLPVAFGLVAALLSVVALARPGAWRRLGREATPRLARIGLAPRRLSRRLAAAAIGLAVTPVVGALALVGGAPAPSAGVATAERAAATARPNQVAIQPLPTAPADPDASDRAAAAPAQPPAWESLVAIERGLGAQQDELATQELSIRRITAILSLPAGDAELLPTTISIYAEQTNALAQLVAAHSATQGAYQQSLQAEYDFYRTAVQNPPVRAQLVAAAAAAPVPDARAAVTYDISTVQTQLAQEQAIALAEGRLKDMGALGGAQLDAIKHHQPFIVPEIAPVTQPFGPTDFALEPPLSDKGTFYPHFHTGIDLAGPLGMPVHAAADGIVLLATASVDDKGELVGYGNYVVIAHPDGFVTLYGHLDALSVKPGDLVRQGQIVGFEGSTGWSTGPHVHFEIRHNGDFLDPAPYLAGQLPT